ncbi:c-type cytochrome [Acuticoccus sp.]|uniref:c-type cytochrome n=1 Tax=Acuticoccus sp. TaxID=1904378 RepID=UPI003B527C89
MGGYEINKFLGAALGALVFIMGLSVLSDILFQEEELEEPAYLIAVAEPEEEATGEEAEPSIAVLLASADVAAGERISRQCQACHAFDDGGADGIGPGLYGVVERPIAAVDGFGYSNALQEHAEGQGWTYEELDGFLEDPQGWVPGTIMGYAGLREGQDRANIIAYLASVTPDAPPFPEPEAAPAEVAEGEAQVAIAAPAQGEAEAGTQAGAVPEGTSEFRTLLASADPANGQANMVVCQACHSVDEGGPNGIGPGLHGVVGRPIAAVEGFGYSEALVAHGEGKEWTYEELDGFLENPQGWVPGTIMGYAGVKDIELRADIVAYLASISPDAPPVLEAPADGTQVAQAAAEQPSAAEGATEAPTADRPGQDATLAPAPAQGGEASTDDREVIADVAAAEDEPNPEAAAAAAELVAQGDTRGAAGRDNADLAEEPVAGVAAAAVDEIAEGDIDELGGQAPIGVEGNEAEARPLASDDDGDFDQLVEPGEAQDASTPNMVQAGAGTDAQPAATPVPASVTTPVSEAVVPEAESPEVGAEATAVDSDVEVPLDAGPGDDRGTLGTAPAGETAPQGVEPRFEDADPSAAQSSQAPAGGEPAAGAPSEAATGPADAGAAAAARSAAAQQGAEAATAGVNPVAPSSTGEPMLGAPQVEDRTASAPAPSAAARPADGAASAGQAAQTSPADAGQQGQSPSAGDVEEPAAARVEPEEGADVVARSSPSSGNETPLGSRSAPSEPAPAQQEPSAERQPGAAAAAPQATDRATQQAAADASEPADGDAATVDPSRSADQTVAAARQGRAAEEGADAATGTASARPSSRVRIEAARPAEVEIINPRRAAQ